MQKPIFLSCFLFFFFVYFIPRQSFSCPQDHREFLLEFKKLLTHNIKNHSTQIALGELKTWRPNSDCCKWKLVRCNTRSPSKEVTDLNLNGLVLFGSVSSTLLRPVLRVSSLMRLDVSSNFIQGEIPGDGFGNLTRLISLDMGRNSFNGTIPPDLFSIKTLQHLDLSMNAIGGTLSGDIKELKNLEELFLDENLIGGEIPPEIGSLTALRKLSLKQNKFSGSIQLSISHLVNLSTLSMSRNNFSGGIPSSIQNLTNLETLELENNSGLSGEIPTWLFHLQKLRKLRLGGNKLQWNKNGSIFPQSKLTHLSLSSCGLEGKIPDWLKNQTDLYFLDLSLNRLEGSFPKWLADLKMENIILSDNRLSGSLSPSLFQSLRISTKVYSKYLQAAVAGLVKEQVIRRIPKIKPTFIACIARHIFERVIWRCSSFFWVKHRKSHHDFISRLSQSLEVLSLRNNFLKGSITEDISTLTSLKVLDLSENSLDGTLPSNLGNLTGMVESPTSSSSIVSSFISEITDLSEIESQDLEVNWKRVKQVISNRNFYLYTCPVRLVAAVFGVGIGGCVGVVWLLFVLLTPTLPQIAVRF
ncbi:receptor-like protein 46 [Brassica rapa]|uniref:receptor-like protein 46 n=1 Tax=Brassica campestris TaxID=3711 RepID=UPI00142E2E09|nr:receptor-like protein 46 [Brassica rapa]